MAVAMEAGMAAAAAARVVAAAAAVVVAAACLAFHRAEEAWAGPRAPLGRALTRTCR